MYGKVLALTAAAQAATINQNGKTIVTLSVDTNVTPFSKAVNTSVPDPTISDARFGRAGNAARKVVLDLAWPTTNVFSTVNNTDVASPANIAITPYASQHGDADLVRYHFHDWYFCQNQEAWTENACINDLCMYNATFWGMESAWVNTHEQEGILGLANVNTTFTSNMDWTVVGNTLFSLSYDPVGTDSILTLGDIDKRYHAPGAETVLAQAVGAPEWGVNVQKMDFAGQDFDINAVALIRHDAWEFELPYPIFNAVTNYYIMHNPQFSRDNSLMLSADCACPDFDDMTFAVEGVNGDTIPVVVTSDMYSTYDSVSGQCQVLFKPAECEAAQFGFSLLEQYIVSFDYTNQQIGFTEREVQHSVQNQLTKIISE